MFQVSVIVLTYYPDADKLYQTLAAAAMQKDTSFEIIVSDDGSHSPLMSQLPTVLAELGIRDYQIIENPENAGTVKNCLGAIRAARGEYVFLTSPGDYLFDNHVLADFYRFAKDNRAKLSFGNAVYYRQAQAVPVITRSHTGPYCPEMYRFDGVTAEAKTHFFGNNWVIGASYFREREAALRYFEAICDYSVYVEDNTSTAFALADGVPLCYFDRNIVWYEDGTGVSTGANDKWKARIAADVDRCYTALKALHPDDPYVDYAVTERHISHRRKRVLRQISRHPVIFLRIQAGKRLKKRKSVGYRAEDTAFLQYLCELRFPTKE